MDIWMYVWMHTCTFGWMDGWMDGATVKSVKDPERLGLRGKAHDGMNGASDKRQLPGREHASSECVGQGFVRSQLF